MPPPDLGPRVRRYWFLSALVILVVMGLLALGVTVGLILDKAQWRMVLIAIGAWSITIYYTLVYPKLLDVHERGFVISRGFSKEAVPWTDLERVFLGRGGPTRRHGVFVTYRGGKSLSVLSGNSGKKTTRAIAEALIQGGSLVPREGADGALEADRAEVRSE
jgi:hypothetical protein